jgi:hypothetical protein
LDLQSIVAELKRERDRLSRALAALEETDSSPAVAKTVAASTSSAGSEHRSSGITPAARQHLSEVMKQRWAARKKKRS